jgi:hypothetical protein
MINKSASADLTCAIDAGTHSICDPVDNVSNDFVSSATEPASNGDEVAILAISENILLLATSPAETINTFDRGLA